MSNKVIGRVDFVKGLMAAGFKYVDACNAYQVFMSTISDGIVSGQQICFGNVGALVPSLVPPRQVRMGFVCKPGGEVEKMTREFFLDSRLKYKFRLYKKFMAKQQLRWFQ